MQRIRKTIRRSVLITLAILVMLGALLVGALVATIPHLIAGSTKARTASELLLSDPVGASREFQSASQSFNASLAGLKALPEPAQIPALIPPFSWYVRLNRAAIYLGRAGEQASYLASTYPETIQTSDPSALLSAHSAALGELLDKEANTLSSLSENIRRADAELSRIPTALFLGKASALKALKADVHTLAIGLPKALEFTDALRIALGKNDPTPRTTLVVYQNDNELRASGGFMGSYSVMTSSSGVIRTFELGTDIYKLDWDLEHKELIPTPPELKTIAPWWGFRDSNIGEGFLPVLGPQIASFYQKGTDIAPTSILFVDLSVLEDILALTGPITLPGTSTAVTADSVSTELTTFVEKEYWNLEGSKETRAPKSIIGELVPVMLGKIRETPSIERAIPGIVARASSRKSIQLWSRESVLQEAQTKIFPSDTPEGSDWIKIVNNNIGGKKSSRNVAQHVDISDKKRGALVERTVTIKRTHNGTGVWPDDENRNYMEIFLPPNAEIVTKPESKGGENQLPEWKQAELGILGTIWPGEVNKEEKWVRVGIWATTTVAEQTTFVLTYRIPETEEALLYIKQAGARNETLKAYRFEGEVKSNLLLEKKKFLW